MEEVTRELALNLELVLVLILNPSFAVFHLR